MAEASPIDIAPGEYFFGEEEYDILSSLGQSEWEHFLDDLAKLGRIASYDHVDDCYTVT